MALDDGTPKGMKMILEERGINTATMKADDMRIVNPRRACAARVTVVGSVSLSVCVSVKSHLTYGVSVHPENAVTYSAGNEGQNICGVFSETAPLQRSSSLRCTAMRTVGHFSMRIVYAHAYFSCIYAHDTPPSAFHLVCKARY